MYLHSLGFGVEVALQSSGFSGLNWAKRVVVRAKQSVSKVWCFIGDGFAIKMQAYQM
jgi:hypothetical protein